MAYIADDIRRLLKLFVFRLFVHPLDFRGAASWGILILCSSSMGVTLEVNTIGHFAFLLKDANATQKPASPSFSKILSTAMEDKAAGRTNENHFQIFEGRYKHVST